jgi:hypothetical protein
MANMLLLGTINQIVVVSLSFIFALLVFIGLIQIMRSFRVFGVWCKLLIGLEIALLGFGIEFTILLAAEKLNKDQSNVSGKDYAKIYRLERCIYFLESVNESTINAVHWVLAFKYWVISRKLELIKDQ